MFKVVVHRIIQSGKCSSLRLIDSSEPIDSAEAAMKKRDILIDRLGPGFKVTIITVGSA